MTTNTEFLEKVSTAIVENFGTEYLKEALPLAKEKFQSALTTTKEMQNYEYHSTEEQMANVDFISDLLNGMLDMIRLMEVVINKATEEDQP